MTNSFPLSDSQTEVLNAAIQLVNGGLDLEEALNCYATIARYVANTDPPDAPRRKEKQRRARLAAWIEQAAQSTS